MQNINIANYQRATDFDINNIAEFLLTEALKSINKSGKVVDGQMWVFIVNENGFEIVMGSCYNILDIFKTVRQFSGRILLRATTLFNNLNSGIYQLAVMQQIESSDSLKHIVTAKINIDKYPFTLLVTEIRRDEEEEF